MALLGLRDSQSTALTTQIDGFLLAAPKPDATAVVNFLKIYAPSDRPNVAKALIARGVDPSVIASALSWFDAESRWNVDAIKGVLTVVAAGAAAFHGYRRNRGSIGWGVAWFLSGLVIPVVTSAIALAQGFGRVKG